jgi:ubiquinone/menaquinone biosynthesis C-methylase UbiE
MPIRYPTTAQLRELGIPENEIEFARVELARSPDYLRRRLEALGFRGRDLVLDCACGIGHWTVGAAALNRRAIGLDFNFQRLRIARTLAEVNELTGLTWLQGDMHNLPFRSACFDGVMCYGAFMFVRPERTMQEFVRILKPGGQLYVNANGAGWYWVELLQRGLFQGKPRLLQAVLRYTWRTWKRRSGGQDLADTIWNRHELAQLMARRGLRVIGVNDEGRFGAPEDLPPAYPGKFGPLEGIFEVVGVKPGGQGQG